MSRPYALVTGASSGIGAEIARDLANRGYPLLLVARRAERLDALRAALCEQVEVVVLAQDLGEPGAARALFEAVKARGLQVEILVNNAGHGMQGRFLDMDMSAVEAMFRLNALALVQLTALFAPEMVRAGRGYVLQVASAAALLPSPYVSAYAASKALVSSFSEALRYELRNTGVSVTTLYPGITRTEFYAASHGASPRLMDLSILSAEQVARIGLRGMFRRRRAVVPGWINRINAVLCRVLPRGLVVSITGWLMERATDRAT